MSSMKAVIVGASGRMGKEIVCAAAKRKEQGVDAEVVGAIEAPGSELIGKALPGVKFLVMDSWGRDLDIANVIIDFSAPAGTKRALEMAAEKEIPILVGTTGLDASFDALFEKASAKTAVLYASNTSVVVNVTQKLVKEAARMLGEDFDIELMEIHHKHKRDSPSGTAWSMIESACEPRGVSARDVTVVERGGTELERKKGEIGAFGIRGGDCAGEHTVYFFGDGERLEITQRATRRSVFAEGAVRAALWLVKGRKPGLYSMDDVLSSD